MGKFIVQFIIVLLFWQNNRKAKGDWLTPSSVLLGIYFVAAACSIGVPYFEGYSQPLEPRYWFPMLEFVSMVLIFLLPFRLFNEMQLQELAIPNKRILNIFSTIIICLSFYAILYYIGYVKTLFTGSISLGDVRQMLYGGTELVEAGLANTIASVSSSLYVFAIFLFFVYSAIGKHKKRRILLLISSISEPLHILSIVGRDGVVFWIFSFIFLYSFFKDYIHINERKRIIKIFLMVGFILLIPFLAISVSRFADSSTGINGSIISYMGQGFINGPLFFGIKEEIKKNLYTDGIFFPLVYEIIGITKDTSRELMEVGEWKSWCFATFIVDLYRDLGLWGMVLWGIVSLIFFCSIFLRIKIRITFAHFFIYILYFQIYGQGVFYFHQYTRGGNLFIVLSMALFYLFLFIIRNQKNIIINKQIAQK